MNIVNVGYGSTNYSLVIGDPAAMLLVTQFHPDHAGLAQELRNAGARLVLMETQLSGAGELKKIMKPDGGYVEIVVAGAPVLSFAASRGVLAGIGIAGEILATPGHSPDSVSRVLDDGTAFTGDLPPESLLAETDAIARDSWRQLRRRGARTIFPAHGGVRSLG